MGFSHPKPTASWSGDHHRLHRLLQRHPQLLPAGAPLLLAVSGGQDSMALLGLLLDLRARHGWRLSLWHGDHRWRPESAEQAAALSRWAADRDLPILVEGWQRSAEEVPSEAAARRWRYDRLARRARELGCTRVVTGHTATDRAETLLLNLARGSHRRGLGSLRRRRTLEPPVELVRPLLDFDRADTARLCRSLALPVWSDASNSDPRFSRNRLRLEVGPVLNSLHPGADRRIARAAEQLAEAEDAAAELLRLALEPLQAPAPPGAVGAGLRRGRLAGLGRGNQSQLLQSWLEQASGRRWPARSLEAVLDRLPPERGPGGADLGHGWHLHWQGTTLWLCRDRDPSAP
ncbi:tRNA lysidine(34) synthetase TilS [Cyanobium sp. CH-040]|uniref:tRNA lysidine(34) synthetase TilS n=1 Tax=Cyanobium sp. CH-040 TaxID=2823708 RepID=UPI0020CDFE64|nr:tRNA lysidine(34) synthetase TilS [Cyanobium sp. CH-040]MCP9927164.1 tRNA lysidine(34) synthetase TilS [Cyanobium sp. CH-040]